MRTIVYQVDVSTIPAAVPVPMATPLSKDSSNVGSSTFVFFDLETTSLGDATIIDSMFISIFLERMIVASPGGERYDY